MLFLTPLRLEVARVGLGSVGRAIAIDAGPTRRRRTPNEHLRNGLGALLHASSEIACRRTVRVSLVHVLRPAVRTELRYGVAELRRAGARSTQFGHKQRTLLAATATVSALAAVTVAVRARRTTPPDLDQPV